MSNTQEFEISSEPFELAKVPLTLGLPTSIAFNAFLVLRMGVDGNITAAVSVSNETNIRALSTINYDNENDQWQFFQASPPLSITTENSFNGSIALSVSPYLGVGLTLAFTSYDTANAGIFLDSNLRFNANIDTALPQINWDYGYFFELNVEANVDVMGTFMDVDYDSTLWDSDYTQLGQGTFYLSSLENTSPLDNAVLNTSPIVFGWSSTISELVTYVVFMGDSEANLDVIGTSSSLTYTLIDTPANGTYFWKVFAVNNDDVIISESSIFSFEFDDTILIPTLTTTSVTQITETTATSGGNKVNDGGSLITARGVCYSTTPSPTIANNTTSDGTNVGEFTSNISGLTENTTYYVRAYATNITGTAYGNEIQLITATDSSDNSTLIVDVLNPITGKTWMDRNLGATQAATSSTDEAAYGDLYQWGRGADGHQSRTSSTTSTLSDSSTPGHGDFILAPTAPHDWLDPKNDNLWQGANGVNNPCPSGYRLPTQIEWEAEFASWSNDNAAGAFASPLKLTLSGLRDTYLNGPVQGLGNAFIYWSSTVSGVNAMTIGHTTSFGSVGMGSNVRARGFSVRCIKD